MNPVYSAGVLFVCTGNICRSPTAEGVFRALAEREWPGAKLVVDSAGTHDYQIGQLPNADAVAAARRRGYVLPQHRARQVGYRDFERFDWILAMDRRNLDVLTKLCPANFVGHLGLLLDFAPEFGTLDVPDPYYGTANDFDEALRLIEGGSVQLLHAIRQRHVGVG